MHEASAKGKTLAQEKKGKSHYFRVPPSVHD